MNKKQLALELNVSRKTLYNYLQELNISELNEESIISLKNHVANKNKSKEKTKSDLINELEKLKLNNAELIKQNEALEKGQVVLLEQLEYYKNDINSEIKQIKQNMTLLLEAPKNEKKSFLKKLFK